MMPWMTELFPYQEGWIHAIQPCVDISPEYLWCTVSREGGWVRVTYRRRKFPSTRRLATQFEMRYGTVTRRDSEGVLT